MKRWLALLLLLPLGACGYNTHSALDEQANPAQSQIEVQLQRRADLIPNLVNTVKGYATARRGRVHARSRRRARDSLSAIQSHDAEQMANANAQLTAALGRLMVVVEAYPQLKADQSFLRLQDELTGTENRIAVSRNDYNQAVNAVQRVHPPIPGGVDGEGDRREGAEILHGERGGAARTADGRLLEAGRDAARDNAKDRDAARRRRSRQRRAAQADAGRGLRKQRGALSLRATRSTSSVATSSKR